MERKVTRCVFQKNNLDIESYKYSGTRPRATRQAPVVMECEMVRDVFLRPHSWAPNLTSVSAMLTVFFLSHLCFIVIACNLDFINDMALRIQETQSFYEPFQVLPSPDYFTL